MKVWGRASRDTWLWANLHMLEASSLLRINSTRTPSFSNMHVPIKAKIVRITSHLRCPTFLPLRINFITRTERAIHHTLSVAASSPSVLSRGYFSESDDHLVKLSHLSLPAENLIKVMNCCVTRCWDSNVVPCDKYELLFVGVNALFTHLLPLDIVTRHQNHRKSVSENCKLMHSI